MRLKAQAEIISAILIFVISFSLASAAYLWGIPLINKKQDTAMVERALGYFEQGNANSLPNIIEDIANKEGEKDFTIDADGLWVLNENEESIQFTFASKVSNIALNTQYPISLTKGVQCTPSPNPPNGTLGVEKVSVVCAQASRVAENILNITYKIYFRKLYDDPLSASPKGYKIDLVKDPAGMGSSVEKTIKISFSSSQQEMSGSETLITKKIKILLI